MKKNVGLPILGITIGDPAGIGPEVILRALADRRARMAAQFIIFGNEATFRHIASALRIRLPPWKRLDWSSPILPSAPVIFVETGHCPPSLAMRGRPTAAGGFCCAEAIDWAVAYAQEGVIDAVVTAPISKEALHLANIPYPGHTEMLAVLTGARRPVMMMAGGGIRAALVTTHAAIEDLPRVITRARVLATVRIVDADLRKHFGLRAPRIAVCGLNPHAGEHGLFGKQDAARIAPAVRQAQREGIACEGPIPADVAFTPAYRKRFDAVVAMYHDQATIPVKMLAFDSGVNVTLGLPIIRTSPDHGTAYDIVKTGIADPGSMIAAILTAAQMARARVRQTQRPTFNVQRSTRKPRPQPGRAK